MNRINILKSEVLDVLENNILRFWLDQMQDKENGGFYGQMTGEGELVKTADKGGILNARILWSFSAAYRVLRKPEYLEAATRAKDYIIEHFIDEEFGGTYWSLDYKGNPKDCDECKDFNFVITGRKVAVVAVAAFFIVAVRSYVGYEIPLEWKDTLTESVMLFVFMGIGKAAGGFLCDKIGIKKTAFISIIGALPFLILGNKIMVISLIGIMFFSMTMAVTLGMVISVMKIAPGAAFGVTTAAIFAGSTIALFTRSSNFITNTLIIVISSAVCFLMALYILKPEREEK